VLCATVRLGDRVLVEQATFPPLLDLLEQLGAEVIGLPIDESGIVPAGLEAALASGPSVLCIQPRAHNPTGVSMTSARARALAGLLGDRDVLVVEDDHAGDIASARAVSLGRWLPERTVHVRSFSKSHGPDLRLAAVGGAEAVVSRVVARRLLGPGWSSRLLQQVLVELLRDPAAIASVAAARAEYAARRAAFCAGLTERGVGFTGSDGINLWIEVADEQAALVSLAAQGIGVAPGRPFVVEPAGEFIRLTVGRVRRTTDELLDAVARAALGAERTAPRRLSR
jgi:DNA-binding transcriptional MocR family regulator